MSASMTRPQTPPPRSQKAALREMFARLDVALARRAAWTMGNPVHGTHPRENGEGERAMSPVRLAGDAWGNS